MNYPIKIAGMILLNKKYICSNCGNEVLGFKDRLSAKEFKITKMCQVCQDKIFGADYPEDQEAYL